MKSAKNTLIAGLALAIALCSSVHAMEIDRAINPYLSSKQKHDLELAVAAAAQAIQLFNQGATSSSESLRNQIMFNQKIKSEKERIERIKKIYYGNRAYTDNEISNILYSNL